MAAYRMTNGLVDHMTIISEAAADRFVKSASSPESCSPVVPNGVDTERFRQCGAGNSGGAAILARRQ